MEEARNMTETLLDIRGLKPESIQAGAEKSPASRAPARERGAPETEGGLF